MICFRRFLKILTGWILATIAASYLTPLILFTVVEFTARTVQIQNNTFPLIIFTAVYATPFVIINSIPVIFIPSVVFIFLAERKSLRCWFIYALAGFVIGAGSITYLMLPSPMADFSDYVLFITTGAVSGFAAGLIYWLIAIKLHQFN